MHTLNVRNRRHRNLSSALDVMAVALLALLVNVGLIDGLQALTVSLGG